MMCSSVAQTGTDNGRDACHCRDEHDHERCDGIHGHDVLLSVQTDEVRRVAVNIAEEPHPSTIIEARVLRINVTVSSQNDLLMAMSTRCHDVLLSAYAPR